MDRKLTRRRRRASALLISGAAIVALVMIVLITSFTATEAARQATFAEAEAARANSRAAFAVLEAVTRAEIGHRDYVTTGSRASRAAYVDGVSDSTEALALLQTLATRDTALAGPAAVTQTHAEARLAFCARLVALRDSGRLREAIDLLLSTQTTQTSTVMRASIFEFVDAAEARYAEHVRASIDQSATADRLAIGLGALALIACLVTGWAVVLERRAWTESQALMAEANAALEVAHAEARASDAAKTRFLAVASHDLRQPLHALSLYISALKRRVEGGETQKIITNMERATQSMINMFSSLLDLARIQSGVMSSNIETIALQDFFERIAAEFATGQVKIMPTQAVVRTDARALEGIMRNLVSNALKHGGGAATLEARVRADGVLACVTDKGPGIAEDQREEIFNEFTRLPGTKAEGLGLGLTIVKRTAERIGLPIVLESRVGEGSTFGVVAPAAETPAAQRGEDGFGPTPLAGVRVIAVDDEAMPLAATAQILRDAGAEVDAADSEDAFTALLDRGVRPDVVVMDLRLHGELRGVELAKAARARLDNKPAVLIVTGDTAPETLAMLHSSGFSWTGKPVKPRDFTVQVMLAASMSMRGPLIESQPFEPVERA